MTPDEIRQAREFALSKSFTTFKSSFDSLVYSALMEIALQLAEINDREQERVEKIYAALSGEPPHAE